MSGPLIRGLSSELKEMDFTYYSVQAGKNAEDAAIWGGDNHLMPEEEKYKTKKAELAQRP